MGLVTSWRYSSPRLPAPDRAALSAWHPQQPVPRGRVSSTTPFNPFLVEWVFTRKDCGVCLRRWGINYKLDQQSSAQLRRTIVESSNRLFLKTKCASSQCRAPCFRFRTLSVPMLAAPLMTPLTQLGTPWKLSQTQRDGLSVTNAEHSPLIVTGTRGLKERWEFLALNWDQKEVAMTQ